MAYLTQSQLEERIGANEVAQLADRERAGVADPAVIASAIIDAEAEINSYLGARYALPISPSVPDQVKSLTAVIARYNLHRRELDEGHPAYIAYRDAVRYLERVASGLITLPLSEGTAEAAQTGGLVYVAPTPTFDTTGLL